MRRHSISTLLAGAFRAHRDWPRQWRAPEPKAEYDVVIVGGGGHGLGTAYYPAREYGIANVAVLEKGWIGGGNSGGTPPLSVPTTCKTRARRSTSTP